MLKAINQWCFPEGTSLEEVFRQSRAAGFDAVELNVYAPGGTGLTMESTAAEVETLGALALKHGLKLRSLSAGLFWSNPLSSPDPFQREKGRKLVSRQLEIAELLGIDTVLVVPGFVTPQVSYDDCYERSQAELRKLLPEAERRGVCIGIENVWNKFLLSPLEMARYIDELGSTRVGAYFDVGNVLLFGFPEQWIRILGKRIRKVHVKDFKTQVGNGHGFVQLLSGDVDWDAVRTALAEIGYDDVLTAELGIYAKAPEQLIFDTSRHMDVIMGRWSR